MNLTSRPLVEIDTIKELRDVIENSDVEVRIIEDKRVDPPIYKIVLADKHDSELILLKSGDPLRHEFTFTIFDLIKVIDRLGFVADYEERK